MLNARHLFNASFPPSMIVEHPTHLSENPKDIPLGSIEGWRCFAPTFHGDPSTVIGPFKAEVVEVNNYKCIVVDFGDYHKSEFFYGNTETRGRGEGYPKRPCWYQSGMTLRFLPNKAN